jgi:hypothetical protein
VKSKIAYRELAAAALFALTQLAAAHGMSGRTGAIASIPGSVVRGHEQGHGLISIITGSTLPQPNPSWETMTRRGQKPDATEVEQARKQVFSHSDQRQPSGGLCLCATSART